MEFEQFKATYSLNVRRANYWSGINYAYDDYQTMGKEKFEKELKYRIELEEFGQEFYELLREKFNADYECVESYYQMMKEKGWSYKEFQDYLEEDEHEDEQPCCEECGDCLGEEDIKYCKEKEYEDLLCRDCCKSCYEKNSFCMKCYQFLTDEEQANYENEDIPQNKVGLFETHVSAICTRCQESWCNECAGECDGECNACTDEESN